MLRPILAATAVLAVVTVAVVGITGGYGADADEAALAIRGTRTVGFSADLQLDVECADHVRVEIRDDPEGSGLDQVTVWGRPRVGRCTPADAMVNTLELDRRAADRGQEPPTKFVDGATSQVVEIA
ncbi:MAG TPA: hypothetical protein VNQ33_06550 [Acidimicrobiales bacterium]|nr:hypothetical protein [Acidimicrobiales bacterium]